MLNDTLKESNFKVMMSQTITGTQEAQWAWLAANYIKKTLKVNFLSIVILPLIFCGTLESFDIQ